jgi:hypothetical protein
MIGNLACYGGHIRLDEIALFFVTVHAIAAALLLVCASLLLGASCVIAAFSFDLNAVTEQHKAGWSSINVIHLLLFQNMYADLFSLQWSALAVRDGMLLG